MTVGNRLNRMMAAKKITVPDLARAIGKRPQYIRNICSGRIKNPGVLNLKSIVDAMGGTMTEFFEGE